MGLSPAFAWRREHPYSSCFKVVHEYDGPVRSNKGTHFFFF